MIDSGQSLAILVHFSEFCILCYNKHSNCPPPIEALAIAIDFWYWLAQEEADEWQSL